MQYGTVFWQEPEVDTARFYGFGTQEDYTRQAGWKQRHLKLATKIQYPFLHGANAYDKVIEPLETSLNVLDTHKAGIGYLHATDHGTSFAGTLRALNKLYEDDKFLQLGISNLSAFEVAEIVMTCKGNGGVQDFATQPSIRECEES